jgi:hypothetical protein
MHFVISIIYSTNIHYYTSALSLDLKNGKLLSNRSAAYLKANYKSKALWITIACIETNTMGNEGGISRYAIALQVGGEGVNVVL